MDREKLMKMGAATRTGGKGSMRRKVRPKAPAKKERTKALEHDMKFQNKYKSKLYTLTEVEEVNIFKEDKVIHFSYPKVQADFKTNMWVFSGSPQELGLQNIIPSVKEQIGEENREALEMIRNRLLARAICGGEEVEGDGIGLGGDVPVDDGPGAD